MRLPFIGTARFLRAWQAAALALVLVITLAGPARAGAWLVCPPGVGQGLPFYVQLIADEPVRDVVFTWGPMRSEASVERTGGGNYEAVAMFATGVDARPGTGRVIARYTDADGESHEVRREVRIAERSFPEQHLTVAKKMVHLSDEALQRHYKEKERVRNVLDHTSRERWWTGDFHRPVPGAVSSDYGLKRYFNGEPRNPHRGIDLRGRKGTLVEVMASGRVALVGDHYFSGKSVYVDHGQGLVSMYFHLSHISVEAGDVVPKGAVIGKIGMTGRVTGPHLHFGLAVNGELVDPMPLVQGKIKP